MQHDHVRQQIILTIQEGGMLGIDSVDAVQISGSERVFVLPDTRAPELIGHIAEAEAVVEAGLGDTSTGDPLVREGLLEARQQWIGLYGGLCAVRDAVESRGPSDQEQFQRLRAELGGRPAS